MERSKSFVQYFKAVEGLAENWLKLGIAVICTEKFAKQLGHARFRLMTRGIDVSNEALDRAAKLDHDCRRIRELLDQEAFLNPQNAQNFIGGILNETPTATQIARGQLNLKARRQTEIGLFRKQLETTREAIAVPLRGIGLIKKEN